jgi:peptidoglycan/LPS O-acetylase OafA/YrhL
MHQTTQSTNNVFVGELASLRGLAALVVCIAHTLMVFDHPRTLLVFTGIPLNSHGAVVLFFVLSGFVLALAWQRSRPSVTSAVRFYMRRGFRILPALWLATIVAVVLLALSPPPGDMSVFSDWMARYDHVLSPRDILMGFLVLDNEPVPPIWTIYIELAGSLAIPVLVLTMMHSRLRALTVAVLLAIISIPASSLSHIFWPAAYMVHFALGVAIALHPLRLSPRQGLAAVCGGVFLLTFGRTLYFRAVTGEWQAAEFGFSNAGAGLVEGAGSAFLIAGIVYGKVRNRVLNWKPLRSLGNCSYSLYLIHFPVMRLVAHMAHPMPQWQAQAVVTVVTVVLSILLAAIIYRTVELPGIALGKRITSAAWSRPSTAA